MACNQMGNMMYLSVMNKKHTIRADDTINLNSSDILNFLIHKPALPLFF
jgi:hypothetical protein